MRDFEFEFFDGFHKLFSNLKQLIKKVASSHKRAGKSNMVIRESRCSPERGF